MKMCLILKIPYFWKQIGTSLEGMGGVKSFHKPVGLITFLWARTHCLSSMFLHLANISSTSMSQYCALHLRYKEIFPIEEFVQVREVSHQDLPTPNALNLSLCCLYSSIISYNFLIPLYSSVALVLLCNTCLTELQESWLSLNTPPPGLHLCSWSAATVIVLILKLWPWASVGIVCPPPGPLLLSQTVLFFNDIIFNYYCKFYWYH